MIRNFYETCGSRECRTNSNGTLGATSADPMPSRGMRDHLWTKGDLMMIG